jgi:hypothetical protein
MKFHFPIVIIDEDFRSENTSGLGIRALAEAIEKEGFEVLGATSYGDLSQFAQQQSRASAFVLSIDDEEFTPPKTPPYSPLFWVSMVTLPEKNPLSGSSAPGARARSRISTDGMSVISRL